MLGAAAACQALRSSSAPKSSALLVYALLNGLRSAAPVLAALAASDALLSVSPLQQPSLAFVAAYMFSLMSIWPGNTI